MVEGVGGFVLVHVATPLEVCGRRDRQGLSAKARAGLVPQFTGVSHPYEEPRDAEIVIDTQNEPPEEAVRQILEYLYERGFLDRVPSGLSEPADPDELLGAAPR